MHRIQPQMGAIVRFGDYELDRSRCTLTRAGCPVQIQPRPLALLLYLVDNRDRVVPRAELLRTVWEGAYVNEQALRFSIHAVRRAVGDNGRDQRVIRTLSRVGVQFVAPVMDADVVRFTNLTASTRTSHENLLDRERQVRMLREALLAAQKGEKKTTLVWGPAGIGKTSILNALNADAEGASFNVAHVRCMAFDEAPPFWPWSAICRQLRGNAGGGSNTDAVIADWPELLWILPELEKEFDSKSYGPTADARSSKLRLFEGVAQYIRAIGMDNSLAVILDDLHQADAESISLFGYLAAHTQLRQLVLAGSYRGQDLDSRLPHGLVPVAQDSKVVKIPLQPLSARSTARLVRLRTGRSPNQRLLGALLATTGGNPYFLEVLLEGFSANAHERPGFDERDLDLAAPASVREIVGSRLEQLSAEVQEVVRVVSIADFGLAVPILHEVVGRESSVSERIGAAIKGGLLVFSDGGRHCRFPHALLREAVYSDLSFDERTILHGRVAKAMEAMFEDESGPHCAEIARHYAAASTSTSARRAIRFLVKAAYWGVERAGFASALDQLDNALRLAEEFAPDDDDIRCRLLLDIGFVSGLQSRRDRMTAALSEASEAAKRLGNGQHAFRAAMLYAPDLLAIETGVYDPRLVMLLEQALELLAEADAYERAQAMARLAIALHWSDESRGRIRELIDGASALAEWLEDQELCRYVETAGRVALYSVANARERAAQRWTRWNATGSLSLLDEILRITTLLQLGRMREVEIAVQEFERMREVMRCNSAGWYVLMFRATLALLKGRYEKAEELRRSFLGLGSIFEDQNAVHSYALQCAMSAIDIGGLGELEMTVSGMAESFPRVEGWQAGLCYLQCELGDLEGAASLMERINAEGLVPIYPRNAWFGSICSLALASDALGDAEIAAQLYDVLVPMSGEMAVVGFGSFCWGATDRFLGVLAGVLGDWGTASRHFEEAVQLNRACGAEPAVAHVWRDRARFAARFGDGRRSRYLEMAQRRARSLGMARLERQIERDAIELG